MKIRSLFQLPRHRQFSYTPRVYDPEKEAARVRFRRSKQADDASLSMPISFHTKRKQYHRTAHKWRLLIAGVLLLLLAGLYMAMG